MSTETGEYTPPPTQEAFDQAIGTRLAKERAKFPDYDALKAKADQFDKLEADNASALDKAKQATEGEKTLREAAEKALATERRETAIVKAATGKVVDADAVVRLIDPDQIETDDAGLPTNAGTLVDSLLKDKPYLKAKGQAQRRPRPAGDDKGKGEAENNGESGDEGEQNGPSAGKSRANEALQRWVESR